MEKIILIHHYFELSIEQKKNEQSKARSKKLNKSTLNVRNNIIPSSGDNSIAFKI
jgi:hypothetical protein